MKIRKYIYRIVTLFRLVVASAVRIHTGSESIEIIAEQWQSQSQNSRSKKIGPFSIIHMYIFSREGKKKILANIDNRQPPRKQMKNLPVGECECIGQPDNPHVWRCRVIYAYAIHFDHTTKYIPIIQWMDKKKKKRKDDGQRMKGRRNKKKNNNNINEKQERKKCSNRNRIFTCAIWLVAI